MRCDDEDGDNIGDVATNKIVLQKDPFCLSDNYSAFFTDILGNKSHSGGDKCYFGGP